LFVSEVALTDPRQRAERRFPDFRNPCGIPETSGERGLAVENQHVLVVRQPRGKRIVHFLKPHKLGFQVANALLETAHFRDHTRIGTTDVAE
jgi:hypothetical protein